MSFWPLTKTLLAELRRGAELGPVLELGAGEGDFARRLVEAGIRPLLLDLRAFAPAPPSVRIRADLRQIPLADASCGALVLANTARHLFGSDRDAVRGECRRVLRSGGRLCLLEDHPEGDDPAAINYRRALELLAVVDPTRGPALDPVTAEADWSALGPVVAQGRSHNAIAVVDPWSPLRWLAAHAGPDRTAAIAGLEESVRRHGMRYGDWWYRVFARETA